MPRSFRVEGADQLRVLSVRLKAADAALYAQLRRDLRAVVTPIAAEVKTAAGEFSTSIPPTIAVRTRMAGRSVGVWIVALASKLPEGHKPLARLQELGSRRNRGVIRHPVYGHDWRVDQPTHPFLIPTVAKSAPRVKAAMFNIVRRTAKVAGFN